MVTIYVGPKTYIVHEELICHKVDYFNKLFKGNFEEATTKTVTLKEDDPDAFGHFINWLYGEAFVCKKDSCKAPVTVHSDPRHILPSIALYVLADKYGVVELAQQCIHVCDTCLVALGNPLTEEEVTVIYDRFPHNDNLKSWAIRSVVEMFYSNCYYTFQAEPENEFKSWTEFEEALDNNHEDFEKDWKVAIKEHLSLKVSECDIHECRYDHRPSFEFVFAN